MKESSCKAAAVSRMEIRNYANGFRKRLHLENERRIDIVFLFEHVFPLIFQKEMGVTVLQWPMNSVTFCFITR